MAKEGPSRRARDRRRSYNIDPLAGLESEVGPGEEARDNESAVAERYDGGQQDESSADEFRLGQGEEDKADESADGEEAEDDEDEEENDIDDEASHNGESVIDFDSDDGDLTPKTRSTKQNTFGKGVAQPPNQNLHSSTVKVRQRRVDEWQKGGLPMRFKTYFGPSWEDIHPALQTRDHWKSQDCMPSRSDGNLRRSFYISEDARVKEVKTTREWYTKYGEDAFAAGQKTRILKDSEWEPYIFNDGSEIMDLLMGGVKEPEVYTLKRGEFMKVSTPFPPTTSRRGWIFNLGTKIQEAQWATNEEGQTQYLAVAVAQNPTKPTHNPLENPNAPAFTAMEPFPASIQIWAFESLENGDMDMEKPPRLVNVICTDWGVAKHFRWWPIGNDDGVVPTYNNREIVHLGLLAGIWSDGRLKVLDVSFRKSKSNEQQLEYTHYGRAAFDVSFPETIPTCLRWLSPTTISAATAAGTIAVWSLNRDTAFPNPNTPDSESFEPKPWLYTQVADTYILTLSSGYSSRPHLLSITTGDGFSRIFDLRSPTVDQCESARTRMMATCQDWHEHTQTFVMPDEFLMLKHASIRRYYANSYTMKLDSALVCCATSPVQPCILIGGVDGTVSASNPTAKILNTKNPVWQQHWFKHEWRRPVDQVLSATEQIHASTNTDSSGNSSIGASVATSSGSTPTSTSILSKPLTRITEGYKPQKIGTSGRDEADRVRESGKLITIFEEQSAITKLAWNPNLNFGTWAVAGTHNGYLRVEDLGV